MASDKLYVGNGKAKSSKFGEQIILSFSERDLTVMQEHLNDKGWMSIYLCKRRETGKHGETHYMTVAIPKDRSETQDEPRHTAEPEVRPAPDNDIPDMVDSPF